MVDEIRVICDHFFNLVDPRVKVARRRWFLEFCFLSDEKFVELYVEKFKEVGLFVREGTIDFKVGDVVVIEEGVDESGLS